MSDSLFSPSWYRVAELKPRLRGHGQIHRHHYRGELWYVLQDHVTGRYYRFTPVTYRIIGMMDGQRTVQDLWEDASRRFGDDAPSQSDMIRLLGQLHAADILICDVPPDTRELLRRGMKIEKQRLAGTLRNPLFLRIPLLDPEKFLRRTMGGATLFFSWLGMLIWTAVVMVAVYLVLTHWSALTENLADRVLAAGNLVIIWFVYPVVKSLHELGHGYAVKKWGGEVHEMGIMLLVFMPIPYIDASAASAFRNKWQRVLVGASGIAVELFLAAVAVIVWVSLEPGLARSAAYNVILIGGVSTVLFNGNPLLRYDGYYILSDLLDSPNLSQRSLHYLGYLFNRHVFGIRKVEPPYTGPGEKFWFVLYATASFVYRLFVYVAIILFVASKFFFIGILFAILGVMNMLIMPIFRQTSNLLLGGLYQEKRGRTILVASALFLGGLAFFFLLPFPYLTRTEGVVWVPEKSIVRAKASGIVSSIKARPGSFVTKGSLLIECTDPFLSQRVEILHAQLREYEFRYNAAYPAEPVLAKIVAEELGNLRGQLARAEENLADLNVHSPTTGVFVLSRPADLPESFLTQGQIVGYVLENQGKTVRIVVPQRDVDLIRERTERVEMRLAGDIRTILPGTISREVPGAEDRLPSMVFGVAGGGEIATDPLDSSGNKTFEKMFQFDVELSQPLRALYAGNRIHVRFDHGLEPLGFQWYREIRQLFLKRFNV